MASDPLDDASAWWAGDRGYQVVERLGVGPVTESFLLRGRGDDGVASFCVLKRLHPVLGDDRDLIRRFVDDATAVSRLRHPNIASVLEVGVRRDLPYLP